MQNRETLVDISISAKPEQLHKLRKIVKDTSASIGVHIKVQNELALAVDEACTNIIKYAYRHAADKQIGIKIIKTDTALIFKLHDDGEPIDGAALIPQDPGHISPGGLGLHFINEIMDKVEFVDNESGGNTLEMIKYY